MNKLATAKSVACHNDNSVYALYYCHKTDESSAYVVPLVGEDEQDYKSGRSSRVS